MDEGLSRAVRRVFVRLYEQGLIYRSDYIVNWCPRCHSALSDLEVEHEEEEGYLWHIRYPFVEGQGEVVVATTRPETMLGDTAVAVHPSDERYADLVGQKVILPLTGREIPVIADAVVEKEFGTGAVKITPAHDLNDYEMGLRHDLDLIVVIDESGRMNAHAGAYQGLDRFECRRRLEEDLQASGYLIDKTAYRLPAGKCYRCKTIIEPALSKQWFVKTKPLADKAIRAVEEGRTRILPAQWEKTYYEWMYNIRDWCISRQIWWGHRIPAWFCDECGAVTVSEQDPQACGTCASTRIHQDTDVLDTWFSSALWPFSTMGWPDITPELKTFYPTSVLITGFDILFFWVARMMMMGLQFMDEIPFDDVYLHALVRDEDGQKMSKYKGNIVDPILEMDRYGADAFRFALTAFAAMGRDVRISDKRIQGYRFFINKIWNAGKFVLANIEGLHPDGIRGAELELSLADKWILTELGDTIRATRTALDGYRFNDAADTLYHFIWHTFCDWYIELSKPQLQGEQALASRWVLWRVMKNILELLHPIIPFVTEEIWQCLPGEKPESIMIADYPHADPDLDFPEEARRMEKVTGVITGLRSIRGETSIPPALWIKAVLRPGSHDTQAVFEEALVFIRELARVEEIDFLSSDAPRPRRCALAVSGEVEIYVPLEGVIDIEREIQRLRKQLLKVGKELEARQKKLGNQNFLDKANPEVVQEQRRQLGELEFAQDKLEKSLAMLEV